MRYGLIISTFAFVFATATMAAQSPKQVCEQLATAAKNNDFATFTRLSSPPGRSLASVSKGSKQKFKKMHQAQMEKIKDLSCETELIAGNQAVVKARSKGDSRLIPFLRGANQWRFDLKTYRAFNQIAK